MPNNISDEYLFIDFEVSKGGKIYDIGAIRGEETLRLESSSAQHLKRLEQFAKGAKAVVGHNIVGHDLEFLRSEDLENEILDLPAIDTLFLSPICFPENPYHRIIKDYKLVKDSLNDPVADAKRAAVVFLDELNELKNIKDSNETLASIYATCLQGEGMEPKAVEGFDYLFSSLKIKTLKKDNWAKAVRKILNDKGCINGCCEIFHNEQQALPMHGYLVAWLNVAGYNSTIPNWVKNQFPDISELVDIIREHPCKSKKCEYCLEHHNPQSRLKHYFQFDEFRPEPPSKSGGSLQEEIVQAGMSNMPLLAILPTGGGKSLCFQLPALVRHFRTGDLTIVLSPLQALIKDQVENLQKSTGMYDAIDAIYGLQTPPERADVYRKLILGDIAILYVSPEQLRNNKFKDSIAKRKIGTWVFDEAHCLSKWGHDFRPDYMYSGRFIKEMSNGQNSHRPPPVACFSATAKEDVKRDLLDFFKNELNQDLLLFDGGTSRENLTYDIEIVSEYEKASVIASLIKSEIPNLDDGAGVVFCSTRKKTEELTKVLKDKEISVEFFHAGLPNEDKAQILEEFIDGHIQVICATNAFGMGVDKANIRLVVHHDIPGSLENYIQEAGRAGRDQEPARCVLLYNPGGDGKSGDIDTQFTLDSFSRIYESDIRSILKSIRVSQKKKNSVKLDENPHIFLSTSEILENIATTFHDDPTSVKKTKVQSAITNLENGEFLQRNENLNRVFQGTALVGTLDEAKEIINKLNLSKNQQAAWLGIYREFLNIPHGENPDIEVFMNVPELAPIVNQYFAGKAAYTTVFRILNDMAKEGLINKDISYTAVLRYKISDKNSEKTLIEISNLENALIKLLQEFDPDVEQGKWYSFNSRQALSRLHAEGFKWCIPLNIANIIGSLRLDGTDIPGGKASLNRREYAQGMYTIKLLKDWEEIRKISQTRISVTNLVLKTIYQKIPDGTARSGYLSVNFTESELVEAIEGDMYLRSEVKDVHSAVNTALRYLDRNRIIDLKGGLAFIFQSMRLDLNKENIDEQYKVSHYKPLALHYEEKNLQIHVMAEYASLGKSDLKQALTLILDYFALDKINFVERYFKGRESQINRALSIESYRLIVEQLNNSDQSRIVSGSLKKNMLILAGPGSGKTRTVAHRCAYLIRVERVKASRLLVLCYNRSAVIPLRKRIHQLAGADCKGITICTFHSLAIRLLGVSAIDLFTDGNLDQAEMNRKFGDIIKDATILLNGEIEIPGMDQDEVLQSLIGSWSHILIDEYQDIDEMQYDFVSAIAGRLRKNADSKLSILAVGDDDQNIYAFRNASTKFIRKFEDDYNAERHHLIENYRSTANIINSSNELITLNRDRMKIEYPIRINKARKSIADGGDWGGVDSVSKGLVQILPISGSDHQASVVLEEIKRIRNLSGDDFNWSDIAIFGRTRKELNPVRALLEKNRIPLDWVSGDYNFPLHKERDVRKGFSKLSQIIEENEGVAELNAKELREMFPLVKSSDSEPWRSLFHDLIEDWCLEIGNGTAPVENCTHFLYDAIRQLGSEKRQKSGVFLGTAHSAKGLEFKHVLVLDESWGSKSGSPSDIESERRLYYVAMTRAMNNLVLMKSSKFHNPFIDSIKSSDSCLLREPFENIKNYPEVLCLKYKLLGMKEMFLDMAANNDRVRRNIKNVNVNDLVKITKVGDQVDITNGANQKIASLSKKAALEWGSKLGSIQSARVYAIIHREKSDQNPEYRSKSKFENWEVPLIEICYK